MSTEKYGEENNLITKAFEIFPYNTDCAEVAMKNGLIDITNSTNISKFKSKISVAERAKSACQNSGSVESTACGIPANAKHNKHTAYNFIFSGALCILHFLLLNLLFNQFFMYSRKK